MGNSPLAHMATAATCWCVPEAAGMQLGQATLDKVPKLMPAPCPIVQLEIIVGKAGHPSMICGF